jgi:hypothetical protein
MIASEPEGCPKIFTQLSRVRHLVVTICCFGLRHDSRTAQLSIQTHDETQNDQSFDFRRALHECVRNS